MPHIMLDNVDLHYQARSNGRATLKDFIVNGLLRRDSNRRQKKALEEVTLDIGEGECVGIIGRNGAGKSTLLRTIAGIYPLAAGERRVEGRICSLFDAAAGMEWNATGWENIRLRAYLQGESPASLEAKLPAIVAFSELGDQLDEPLRTLSSGKIMLLSFAIATACDPDILLVDEFLSTGDLVVREKAIARMIGMLRQSRIVVAASHDLAFLRQFCTRIVWIERGRMHADGPTECVIERYTGSMRLTVERLPSVHAKSQ